MIPIRVKLDSRCQQFKLVEPYNGHLFEDGEDYCLVPDRPDMDAEADDFDEFRYIQRAV